MIYECLSTIRHQDGTLEPCCKQVKGQTYPLCKRHFKRRFNPNNLLFKQLGSSHFCHQLIKTGKNKGMYCSKHSFRNKLCLPHLEEHLGKCYFPGCTHTSFYKSGLCSYHTIENPQSPCPCCKHVHDKLDNQYYFCQQHQEIECDCLPRWRSPTLKNNIYLPSDILLSIFDYGDCYLYSNIKCLNKYFNKYDYRQQLISKYCCSNNFLDLDSSFKIEQACNNYYFQLFELLTDTYNFNYDDVVNIDVYPDSTTLKFRITQHGNTDFYLIHTFVCKYCLIMSKNKNTFINILRQLFNVYLSNLSMIIAQRMNFLLEILQNISRKFNFFVGNNFLSEQSFRQYRLLNDYLIRFMDNNLNHTDNI